MNWRKAILITCLLYSNQVIAQDYPCAHIELWKMNVFYVGVANPVACSASGYLIEEIYIKIDNGATIEPDGLGSYKIYVPKKGTYKVEIYHRNTKGGMDERLSSATYRAKEIPVPDLYLAGVKTGGSATHRSVIREARSIEGKPSAFDFQVKFEIAEFSLTVITASGKRRTVKNIGSQFGPQTIASLASVEKGDIIMISEAKGKYKESDTPYALGPAIWIAD